MLGNWIFFFEGILRIGVSVATIVYQVQPFIVLVAGAILFQERLGLTKLLLFLVAVFGFVTATATIGLISVAATAAYWLLARRHEVAA